MVAGTTLPRVECTIVLCTIVLRRRVVSMQTRLSTVQVAGAMLMMLAALTLSAVPALGQARGDDVQYNAVCQNVIGQLGDINAGNVANQAVTATGGDGGGEGGPGGNADAVAEIAQETSVSIEQVNECLNGADIGGDGDREDDAKTRTAETGGADTAAERQYNNVIAATIPKKPLPNTGGLSLLGLTVIGLTVFVVGFSVFTAGLRR